MAGVAASRRAAAVDELFGQDAALTRAGDWEELLGDLKLIRVYETGVLQLFNVANDPSKASETKRDRKGKAKERKTAR